MTDVLQLLISGMAYGSIYALVALGFILIYNSVGVINFAQGEFVMVPAFLSVVFLNILKVNFFVSYLLTIIIAAGFGILFQRVTYFPLRNNRSYLPVTISTIGASIILQNIALIIFGGQPFLTPGFFEVGKTLNVAGVAIVPQYLLIIAVTIALVVFQYFLFEHTTLGKRLQATAQDRQTAQLMGIRVDRMIIYTFMYSAMLGAVGALLISPLIPISTSIGSSISLKAFAATIIGGFGSIPGAIFGGIFLGIAEAFLGRYVSTDYQQGFAFILLIVVLLIRPEGLFGEKISQKA